MKLIYHPAMPAALLTVSLALVGCGHSPTAATAVVAPTPAPVLVNAEYSYGSDPAQKLDLYLPAAGPSAPLVIVIHGGGWTHGDKHAPAVGAVPADFLRSLVAAGFVVLNVNYRLTKYPDPLDDLELVAAWARERGFRSTYSVVGYSAGANLAALHCAPAPGCDGVVGVSGAYDLTRHEVATQDQAAFDADMVGWVGCALSACPDRWVAVSPALIETRPRRGLFIYGDADATVRPSQSQQMAQHLGAAGSLVAVPGAGHGDPRLWSGAALQNQLVFLAGR